jgi:ABC-type branched-subunit amino acid transport system substrate-binding protein
LTLHNFSNILSEKIVFSATAEAQKIAIEKAEKIPEDPLILLKKYGIVQTKDLLEAVKQLVAAGLLDEEGCRVTIELVRRWLIQRHPFKQQMRELEILADKDVNSIYKVANTQAQQSQIEENGTKKKDLNAYGVLTLSTDNLQISEDIRLSESKDLVYSNDRYSLSEPHSLLHTSATNIELFKPKSILIRTIVVMTGIISLVGIGVGVYRWSTPCQASEQKVLGIFCQVDSSINISRGERTFFLTTRNPNRDQGIEAFKRGNYADAAEFFEQAVASNRRDPEALIYLNNALAHKQGSHVTLAVVVSAENAEVAAKGILRGVAQAQNQFNKKGGLKGQLLEIVIANDVKDRQQAQQMFAELVKDSSILGVIGQSSSVPTKTELAAYEKANLAIISPTNTSELLESNVFFQTRPSNAAIAQSLAEYAKNSLDLDRVVIFFNKSEYSNNLKSEFIRNFQQLEGKVVREIDLTEPQLDVKKVVQTSVFVDQAQVAVLFPDTKQISTVLGIAKANDNLTSSHNNPNKRGLKLLGEMTLYSNIILAEGRNAVEGLILAVPWSRETPQAKNFLNAAAKQWGEGEKVNWASFDATQAFLKALSPNPKRPTVLQRLRQVSLSPEETSGYTLRFNQNGERNGKPILLKVKDNKFQLVP